MTPTAILDPAQLVDRTPARNVDDIVAKLYLHAWNGETKPQMLGRMQLISDPVEAADLLMQPDHFPKYYSFLTELGRSRLDANGADWEKRRDLTQPLYREAARTANRAPLTASYARWLTDDAIQSGRIGHALLAAASEIFLHALGGSIPTGPVADWLLTLRETAQFAQHVAMFDPSPAQHAKLREDVAQLRQDLRGLLIKDEPLKHYLHDRLVALDHSMDLLGEVTINLFAGVETTVASISWALNILARDPEMQAYLAREVALHGTDAPALSHFIQEVMRYCPPVPLLVRTVAADNQTLAGRPVAKGDLIALSIVGLHHHRDHWNDPASFDAKRPEFVENSYHRRAYLPFSAGPRVCGGLGLARAEVAIALGQLLQRYRVLPVTTPITYELSLNLRPRGTSQLQFEPL
ncbi:cytochrome P450 [Loktanella ponticola]|uniref:Cytochrome P450 n=1 Tax=Yoonia ponticola TaxID=1524255 RepID=A0A7W9BLG3_9RHOB|nr:cytochrome P450 [Yoonia ponticola]MBB5722249.1 cytochrome P450 [Yoonia ponticola]